MRPVRRPGRAGRRAARPLRRPGGPAMIALTLAEVAAAVDGRLVGRRPGRPGHRHGRVRLPQGAPRRALRRVPRREGRRPRLRGGAVAAGAVAVLGSPAQVRRRADGAGRRRARRDGPAGPRGGRPAARADRDRADRLVRQDHHQGPDRPAHRPARGRRWRRPARSTTSWGTRTRRCRPGRTPATWCWRRAPAGSGHIRYLCDVVPPRISVVLNVGRRAHRRVRLGGGDRRWPRASWSRRCPPTGWPCSTPTTRWSTRWPSRTAARVVRYGEAADADVRAVDVTLDERGRPSYTLVTPEGSRAGAARADRPAPGRQLAGRRGGGPGAGHAAGRAGRRAGRAGAGLDPPDGRLRPPRRGDGDRRLVQRQPGVDGGRAAGAGRHAGRAGVRSRCSATWPSWATFERDGHAEVGRLAAELGVDRLLVVGEPAAPIHEGATAVANWGGESVLLTDQAAAVEVLRGELRPGDVVLVKGSRYRTWEVADALRDARRRRAGDARRVRAVIVAIGGRVPRLAVLHPDRDQGLHPAQGRPADPGRGPGHAPGQEGHARRWAAWSSSWPRSSRTWPGTSP